MYRYMPHVWNLYNIPVFQAPSLPRNLRRRGTEIIAGKDSHTRIKPSASANGLGHGRYITATPKRNFFLLEWPLLYICRYKIYLPFHIPLLNRLRNGRFAFYFRNCRAVVSFSEANRPPGPRSGLKHPLGPLTSSDLQVWHFFKAGAIDGRGYIEVSSKCPRGQTWNRGNGIIYYTCNMPGT
jgi:hypothetical protein